MDAVLTAVCTLAGTVLGSVLQHRAARRDNRDTALAVHHQTLRDTIAALVHTLSVHRGHLYRRWDLSHDASATAAEKQEARRTSHASRGDVTHALYRLRALTQEAALLRAAEAAVDATYAVKGRGEDLASVTSAELAARRLRAIEADNTLLATSAARLSPA